MKTVLATDHSELKDILRATTEVAGRYIDHQKELPPSRLEGDLPAEALPQQGWGAKAVLERFSREYAPRMANSAGPRYFGFVTGGATPASVSGDWLVSVFDQVMSGSSDSVAHALERQTISFLMELFGLERFSGTFVTGATMSNFVSLATARQWVGEQYGRDISRDGLSGQIPIQVLSATPHSSILKSLSMLGLGRESWVKVDTLPEREAIDVQKLEQQLKAIDRPVVVVANAGTVNTVDFDDLKSIALLKEHYPFFLHVDAAFGGFAAASPRFKDYVNGINSADTVTVDAHKWLNVPYDSAMQFTRHQSLQIKVFQNNAAYLGDLQEKPDSMHLTPENSRRFRALPAWFSLQAYGREGYREIIERHCDSAMTLGGLIDESSQFRLLAPVKMNVVCFSFRQECTAAEIGVFLNAVRDDGRVFFTPTLYQGVPGIRAAFSNWQTTEEDARLAFEVLCHVHQKMTAYLNYK